MGFTDAVKSVYTNYVNFAGRAARPEYWYFFLFNIIVQVVLQIAGAVALGQVAAILLGIFALGSLLPGIAVAVRRMHDLDKSGWMLLIGLIPVVGAILLIVWFCKVGTPGPNKFGPAVG